MTHNRRVLIVDDQRAIHDDFRKLLEAAPASAAAALEQTILGESPLASVDYEIESAYQGEAGLEAVRHARTPRFRGLSARPTRIRAGTSSSAGLA
jgi:CheY-like chemotaxis protein